MILLVHLLFGAAIGSAVKNMPLAIILAFLGHYLLDFFPHAEYSIEISKKTQWYAALLIVFKIILDFSLGILLILMFSKNQPIIYLCAFLAIVPDGLTLINKFVPNKIFEAHLRFHTNKIHFFKNKKISIFWKIATQLTVVIISVVLLKI